MFKKCLKNKNHQKLSFQMTVRIVMFLYILLIMGLCFSPQKTIPGVSTPNIINYGKLYFLLVPFNSIVSLKELTTSWHVMVVIGQNVSNIFLLYPLGLCFYILSNKCWSYRTVCLTGLCLSGFIEAMQLVLDFLFDFNRVFEVDDLWTNALGFLLAYMSVKLFKKRIPSKGA